MLGLAEVAAVQILFANVMPGRAWKVSMSAVVPGEGG